MISADERRLLRQACRLTILGLAVERERGKLEKLADRGVSYDDPKFRQAWARFNTVALQRTLLEAEHVKLRQKIEDKRRK